MKQSIKQTDKNCSRPSGAVWLITIASMALVAAWSRTSEGQITNGVFVSGSSPFAQTYAQWSAAWWQWNFSLPTTNNPIQDTALISTKQGGPVWFLGGTFGLSGNQTRVRSGSVPEGIGLFVAIMESWADDADCPNPDNFTTTQLRSLAANSQDQVVAMSCTIDGHVTVDLNTSPNPYRVQSPVFNYTVPGVHNYLYDLFGATCYFNPGGTPIAISGAVADGEYLMVAPLASGAHTIHFSGSVPTGFIVPPYFYTQDVTYNLTVVPTPALAVARQANNLVLSWPQAASWYILETSTSLSPANWVAGPGVVRVTNGLNQVSIPIGTGTQLFRLRRN